MTVPGNPQRDLVDVERAQLFALIGRLQAGVPDAGLLQREQRGKWAYFSLKRDAVERLAAVADLKGVCC